MHAPILDRFISLCTSSSVFDPLVLVKREQLCGFSNIHFDQGNSLSDILARKTKMVKMLQKYGVGGLSCAVHTKVDRLHDFYIDSR